MNKLRNILIAYVTALLASTTAHAADLVLQTGTFEHDGERFYYESVGSGDAIVLSHGAGGTHAVWYQQVPVLAQKYRVITWDQRGFGRTTDTRKLAGPDVFSDDLGALLDHLKIQSAHIVGQSMGGWTVLGFALKHPERVRSLVLADTFGGVQVPQPTAAAPARASLPPEQLPITQHPGLADALGKRDPAKAFLYRELGGATPPGVMDRLQQSKRGLAEVRKLQMPTLLIVGELDASFTPATTRALAAEIKGAQVAVIAGAGHSPYFEMPDAWNAAYTKFLAGLAQR